MTSARTQSGIVMAFCFGKSTQMVVELAAANVVVRASKAACPESVASRVRSDVALACSRTSREWARASLGSSSRRTGARN